MVDLCQGLINGKEPGAYLRDAEGAQAFRVLLLVGLGAVDILEQVDAAGFARGLVLGPDLPA